MLELQIHKLNNFVLLDKTVGLESTVQ